MNTPLLTALYVSGQILMPPHEYTHTPTEPYRIEITDRSIIDEVCDRRAGEGIVFGCWNPNTRVIHLRSNLTPQAMKVVLFHERAHVNGWMHE